MAYGSPESTEELMPYLQGIYEGRPVPEYALQENRRKYSMVNGVSPSNNIIIQLLEKVRSSLLSSGISTYLGNKHWKPWLKDAVNQMKRDGIDHIIALPIFPFQSKNVEKSYMEPLEQSVQAEGGFAEISFLNGFSDDRGFVEMWARILNESVAETSDETLVLFTAHSLPLMGGEENAYNERFRRSAQEIASKAGISAFAYAYQSRGKYGTRWLEPSIESILENENGFSRVLAAPIGFCYEHMEILYDLDFEFGSKVRERGMEYIRTRMPDSDKDFVSLICNQATAASWATEVST